METKEVRKMVQQVLQDFYSENAGNKITRHLINGLSFELERVLAGLEQGEKNVKSKKN